MYLKLQLMHEILVIHFQGLRPDSQRGSTILKIKTVWCFVLSFVWSLVPTQAMKCWGRMKDLSLPRSQLAGQVRWLFHLWETCEAASEIRSWRVCALSWCTRWAQKDRWGWATQGEGICCPCSLTGNFGEGRTRIFCEGGVESWTAEIANYSKGNSDCMQRKKPHN